MNKLGFGFLRLPRTDPDDVTSIDMARACELVDAYLAAGGRYFDSAYTYLGGASEKTLGEALAKRHPRESFEIATKIPSYDLKDHQQCWEIFEEQRRRCCVEYFDTYMLHWLNDKNYIDCENFDGFGFLREVKAKGFAKRIGFSYHAGPELLDRILTEHPETECVLLQINYLDWESPTLRARECSEVVKKHGKQLLVMEPVRGGALAELPPKALAKLEEAGLDQEQSIASWAIRFVESIPYVDTVLSGMGSVEQIKDNVRDKEPLTEHEWNTLLEVAELLRSEIAVPCTACRYCEPHCPMNISIPEHLALMNQLARAPGDDWKLRPEYNRLNETRGKPSVCIACGQCQEHCPPKIAIPDWM
ncbi:MAG: aldo/keto reductase, partial [Clostridia bacterium]|nr:aldo/keto reductase [Clostridia bacterium]